MNISWMSRSLPTRPLIRYSLWPERYRRRLTTTSPGLIAGTGFSANFLFRLNLPPDSAGDGAEPSAAASCVSGACAGSSERISVTSVKPESSLFSVTRVVESVAESDAALSITKRAASASSGSSMVMVTSASPRGGRLVVPLKMQSAMRSARSDLWLCSPRTQEMASTTLDLPQPFGPTMQVVPDPLNVTTVRSQNDLKPTISTFRSFSKMSPFGRQLLRGCQHEARIQLDNHEIQPFPAAGAKLREERRLFVPRGEGLWSDRSTLLGSSVKTFGRFSVRGPAAWRKDGGTGKNSNTMRTACKALRYDYATTCGCFASATSVLWNALCLVSSLPGSSRSFFQMLVVQARMRFRRSRRCFSSLKP